MQGLNRRGLQPASPSTHGLRMKRAIIGRRAGPTTPIPSWKLFNNQLYDGITGGRPPLLSARKLAASLWELQDLPLPACLSACLCSPRRISHSSRKGSPGTASSYSQSDPRRSPASCKSGNQKHVKSGAKNTSRNQNGTMQSAALRTHLHRLLDKSNVQPAGVDRQRHIPSSLFPSTRNDQPGQNVTTMSNELLKVFSQIRVLEEQHNSSLNLTTVLRTEVMRAHAHVRELELAQKLARREVESLVKRFADEKTGWKLKEQDKINAAVNSAKEDLEEERKARRKYEATNRKLAKELLEFKTATGHALQELEKERKARQLMEEVCNQLAREIGDDKAEVEELKRESQKVREEIEEERRMLQLAEVWREERVQMKLGEAKLALEEKSTALDVMRTELESFLRAKEISKADATTREAQVMHNAVDAVNPDNTHSYFLLSESKHMATPESDLYTMELSHDGEEREIISTGNLLLSYPEGIPDAD